MSQSPRLKLPAYAKALLTNRRRGFHPLEVYVWYGDSGNIAWQRAQAERVEWTTKGRAAMPYSLDWERRIGKPMVWLCPRDYAPGVFDFRVLTGLAVTVWDADGGYADIDGDGDGTRITRWGLFYDLLNEVSACAATVFLKGTAFPETQSVAEIAALHCVDGVWPRWWSDELQEKHVQRRQNLRRAERECIAAAAGGH